MAGWRTWVPFQSIQTLKPSGSASLLLGCPPPSYSSFKRKLLSCLPYSIAAQQLLQSTPPPWPVVLNCGNCLDLLYAAQCKGSGATIPAAQLCPASSAALAVALHGPARSTGNC